MKAGRAPNYRLRDPHTVTLKYGLANDTHTFPEGTFVRPVERKYLPVHLLELVEYRYMNEETHVACHTQYGFHLIPRVKLEGVQ